MHCNLYNININVKTHITNVTKVTFFILILVNKRVHNTVPKTLPPSNPEWCVANCINLSFSFQQTKTLARRVDLHIYLPLYCVYCACGSHGQFLMLNH